MTQSWRAGTPAAPPHTFGRTPAYASSPAARAEVRAPTASWSQRPAPAYGSAAGYGHPYNSGWSPPATRPSYGAPSAYGAQNGYRAPMNTYRAPAPAPAYHAPSYSQAPRSFAPPSSGGFSHFSSPSGGGSHFGGSGGGHFGGFGGGGRRR